MEALLEAAAALKSDGRCVEDPLGNECESTLPTAFYECPPQASRRLRVAPAVEAVQLAKEVPKALYQLFSLFTVLDHC